MNTRPLRLTGALMIAGAILANLGFILLGSKFDYPAVLDKPAAEILQNFHADASVIGALFVVLAAASAVLIPVAWFARPLIADDRPRTRRLMVAAGTAAGIVQVIGLLRWPLLVPHYADIVSNPATTAVARADAIDTFKTLHTVLGGVIGEALGYALTATWTLAMVVGVARRPGRWFAPLGIASAGLIATGLLEPLVSDLGFTNFLGYIAWSIWMIAFGISLLRRGPATIASRAPLSSSRTGSSTTSQAYPAPGTYAR
jgi:Domain of unknown function (DUF4386)